MKNVKHVLTTLALATSLTVGATESDKGMHKYKMAVIDGDKGADLISRGQYQKGISVISHSSVETAQLDLTQIANLCVAYTKLGQWHEAAFTCDLAIDKVQVAQLDAQTEARFTAVTFNNRAVLKLQTGDNEGALQDFLLALSAKKEAFVNQNLVNLVKRNADSIRFARIDNKLSDGDKV